MPPKKISRPVGVSDVVTARVQPPPPQPQQRRRRTTSQTYHSFATLGVEAERAMLNTLAIGSKISFPESVRVYTDSDSAYGALLDAHDDSSLFMFVFPRGVSYPADDDDDGDEPPTTMLLEMKQDFFISEIRVDFNVYHIYFSLLSVQPLPLLLHGDAATIRLAIRQRNAIPLPAVEEAAAILDFAAFSDTEMLIMFENGDVRRFNTRTHALTETPIQLVPDPKGSGIAKPENPAKMFISPNQGKIVFKIGGVGGVDTPLLICWNVTHLGVQFPPAELWRIRLNEQAEYVESISFSPDSTRVAFLDRVYDDETSYSSQSFLNVHQTDHGGALVRQFRCPYLINEEERSERRIQTFWSPDGSKVAVFLHVYYLIPGAVLGDEPRQERWGVFACDPATGDLTPPLILDRPVDATFLKALWSLNDVITIFTSHHIYTLTCDYDRNILQINHTTVGDRRLLQVVCLVNSNIVIAQCSNGGRDYFCTFNTGTRDFTAIVGDVLPTYGPIERIYWSPNATKVWYMTKVGDVLNGNELILGAAV
jgi:hypothetical protein